MTDIQRHLKGIRKILANAIVTATDSPDLDRLFEELRAFLPKSYGLGAGHLVGSDGCSQPVPLLVYDVPLSGGAYSPGTTEFRLEHVLLIAYVGTHLSADSLRDVLSGVASVKRFQTLRERQPRPSPLPPGQARRTIPRDRLPFGLVMFNSLDDYPAQDRRLYAALMALLDSYSAQLLPDQIDILGQNAQYLNPLLDQQQATWFDIGWSRTPDRRDPDLCYVCKRKYFRRHFFYDQLCLACGDLNYQKRHQSADLSGFRFLVTGARLKIGYAVGLRLLRAGAEVIATSRFPRDTARRYAQERDFVDWRDRLHVYALDLRQIPQVDAFARYVDQTYPYLDGIINNAAQTVKRPPAFYAHLLAFERAPLPEIPAPLRALLRDGTSADPVHSPGAPYLASGQEDDFPDGKYDEHGQQLDNRDFTSWEMQLEDVSPAELVEVHLVNAVAPALLAGQLKAMLQRSPHDARFIVNVSAAEGRFDQFKAGSHPHTNMAKAALNMLTRSVAEAYAREEIFVSSVDPGWVSDQMPRPDETARQRAQRPPLDMEDAASRVCDPIFSGIRAGQQVSGKLLKDYGAVSW